MGTLETGLYEQLITQALEAQLQELDDGRVVQREALHAEEAGDRIALHFGRLLHRVIDNFPAAQRRRAGLELMHGFIHALARQSNAVGTADLPDQSGDILRAISTRLPDGGPRTIPSPPRLCSTPVC